MEDSSQVAQWLTAGQGAELHWFPEDVPLTRLAATLVGMANTRGGIVVLGVAPRRAQVLGVSHPEETTDRIFQAALLSDPPLVLPLPRLWPAGEMKVMAISVPAGLPHVYALEGRYLGREGSLTNPLPARRLRQLLLERGVVQFEALTPSDASLDDLDPAEIEAYLQRLSPGSAASMEEALLRRGCLKSVNGSYQPTYAAILLFGRYPQQWLPASTILAARFAGPSFTDSFVKQELRGTLPQQLRAAEVFVRENLRSTVRLAGLEHQEVPEYPFEALRELLVNAVAHREYNQQGDSIHLNIFSDRLEVQSPGGLPGPVTLENLLEARFSRNAVIVQILSDMGFVERLGYGLDRVVAVMRQSGLSAPRFEELGGTFRATLFGEPLAGVNPQDLSAYINLQLNPRQQAALVFLSARKRITNSDYQALCPEVHPETLRRDLSDLVARGVLIKIGDKRATYYILK